MAQEPPSVDPYPTLLRTPTWYGGVDEAVLPFEPKDYSVEQTGPDRWTVTVKSTGQVVYHGIGPAEVVESPAPF